MGWIASVKTLGHLNLHATCVPARTGKDAYVLPGGLIQAPAKEWSLLR